MSIIIVYLLVLWSNRKDFWNALIWPIVAALVFWFMVGGAFVGGVLRSNPKWLDQHDWLSHGWDIKSVKFDSAYKGAFVLGTGSFERQDYYYVYTYMGNNTWQKQRFLIAETFIRETDTPPRALAYRRTFHSNWYKKWFWGIENFLDIKEFYILEIPKGSIIEEFKP